MTHGGMVSWARLPGWLTRVGKPLSMGLAVGHGPVTTAIAAQRGRTDNAGKRPDLEGVEQRQVAVTLTTSGR